MGKVNKSFGKIEANDNVDEALAKINEYTKEPLSKEDVFLFDIYLASSESDRVGDKMTPEFMEQFVSLIKDKGLIGLKDHDWESKNASSRLYDVEVVESEDELDEDGNKLMYVLGHAYMLRNDPDVERVNAGLLSGVSVSFASSGDRCSICGETTVKGEDDIAVCKNEHRMLETYDGQVCHNLLCHCDDVYEYSFVPVPCQRHARVKNKELGGNGFMKRAKFLANKLLKSKSLDADVTKGIEEIVETSEEAEVSEDDVRELIEENAKLKSELEAVQKELADVKEKMAKSKACGAVEKEVDALEPLTDQVKSDIMDKIDFDKISFDDDDKLVGFDEQIEEIKKAYKGLFKTKSVEEKQVVKAEPEKKVAAKAFNPTFGVGQKQVVNKKSFSDACNSF